MVARPRRSALYMPGSNPKAMAKARELPADAIILDLEDSVAPDAKPEARDRIVEAVRAGGFGNREVLIRVNGLHTPWGEADLEAAVAAAPDGVLLPKVDGPGTIMQAATAVAASARKDPALGDDGDADGAVERKLDRRHCRGFDVASGGAWCSASTTSLRRREQG